MTRRDELAMAFRIILVALDPSPTARQALAIGLDLARRYHSRLACLSIAELPDFAGTVGEVDEAKRAAIQTQTPIVERACAEAKALGVPCRASLLFGHVAETIGVHAQRTNADLIVVARHWTGDPSNLLHGSISTHVLRHAPCAVLIV